MTNHEHVSSDFYEQLAPLDAHGQPTPEALTPEENMKNARSTGEIEGLSPQVNQTGGPDTYEVHAVVPLPSVIQLVGQGLGGKRLLRIQRRHADALENSLRAGTLGASDITEEKKADSHEVYKEVTAKFIEELMQRKAARDVQVPTPDENGVIPRYKPSQSLSLAALRRKMHDQHSM